jgi:protein O-mannosyl-transferase
MPMALLNMTNETSLTPCRRNIFAFVSLFLLILITYSNTFDASWHFDDENNILNNKPLHLTELNLPNIQKTFFANWNGSGKLYRPVACLSFALNYYFGGTEVIGYHLINLMIHFLSSIFLFLFVYHTLRLPNLEARYGPNAYFIALLSAVLWAINPVQTQAVTYVVQRMTSMAALFSIMAMYFYLKGRTATPKLSRGTHYSLCIGCGLLALGSKENAVMLPVVILIYDLFLLQGVTKENLKRYSFFLLIAVITCVTLALLIAGPSIFDPESLISGYQNRGFTLWERLLTEPRVILFYISLLLYPMPDRLCLEHGITLSTNLTSPIFTIMSIVAVLLILCTVAALSRKSPFISFCIIFFFLNHLIEASLLPLELIFEHRNYLPSMLFFVPLSILLSNGIQYFSKKRRLQGILIIFTILVLMGWGHSTYARNMIWKNDGILSFDCMEKYPDLARPHHNLARFYAQKKRYYDAIDEYRTSLSKENINNLVGKNWTYYNLGSIYQELGKDEKAMHYYEQAQKYQPFFAPTHIRKGQLFVKKGHYEKAEAEFQKALQAQKQSPAALKNLGHLYLRTNQNEKAMAYLQQALGTSPQDPNIMGRLGLAYRLMNRSGKASFLFKASLEINPNNPFILLEIAQLYDEKGMVIKKGRALDRFFAVFGGTDRLRRFIEDMDTVSEPENALSSHQRELLRFLAVACQNRSREYEDLARGLKSP